MDRLERTLASLTALVVSATAGATLSYCLIRVLDGLNSLLVAYQRKG